MTPENFCYWLQGFFEITNAQIVKPEQVKVIKDHLALVFQKVTPVHTFGGSMIGIIPTGIKATCSYVPPGVTASPAVPFQSWNQETKLCSDQPAWSPDMIKFGPCASC